MWTELKKWEKKDFVKLTIDSWQFTVEVSPPGMNKKWLWNWKVSGYFRDLRTIILNHPEGITQLLIVYCQCESSAEIWKALESQKPMSSWAEREARSRRIFPVMKPYCETNVEDPSTRLRSLRMTNPYALRLFATFGTLIRIDSWKWRNPLWGYFE